MAISQTDEAPNWHIKLETWKRNLCYASKPPFSRFEVLVKESKICLDMKAEYVHNMQNSLSKSNVENISLLYYN